MAGWAIYGHRPTLPTRPFDSRLALAAEALGRIDCWKLARHGAGFQKFQRQAGLAPPLTPVAGRGRLSGGADPNSVAAARPRRASSQPNDGARSRRPGRPGGPRARPRARGAPREDRRPDRRVVQGRQRVRHGRREPAGPRLPGGAAGAQGRLPGPGDGRGAAARHRVEAGDGGPPHVVRGDERGLRADPLGRVGRGPPGDPRRHRRRPRHGGRPAARPARRDRRDLPPDARLRRAVRPARGGPTSSRSATCASPSPATTTS